VQRSAGSKVLVLGPLKRNGTVQTRIVEDV
jgi:hypothetical protein